jgi:hypothetical protein
VKLKFVVPDISLGEFKQDRVQVNLILLKFLC